MGTDVYSYQTLGSSYISRINGNTLNAQWDSNNDTGDFWINFRGYQDGFTHFRDFRIGDGKGTQLFYVQGSSGNVSVTNTFTAANITATGALGGSLTATQVFNAINLANNPDWYRTLSFNTGFYNTAAATGLVFTQAGRVDIYNGAGLFVPGNITCSSSILSGEIVATTVGSTESLVGHDDGGNGANIKWQNSGGNKYIRALANQMQWINAAYSAVLTVLDNAGNFYPAADNAMQCGIGTNRWSAIFCPTGVVSTSDGREKNTIVNSTLGLNFINALRPVSYKYNVGSNVIVEPPVVLNAKGVVVPPPPLSATIKPIPGSRTHWGLISQEVKLAVDAAGVDFGGFVLTDVNDPNSMQGLRYDQFIAPLIKAVQELTARVVLLENSHIPPIIPPAGP